MTKRETAVLACRLFTIYGLFTFLSWAGIVVQGGWSMFRFQPGTSIGEMLLLIAFVTPTILILFFSIWIWRNADWLASKLLPEPEVSTGESTLNASDLQIVAFSVVGLLVIVEALPQISSIVLEYMYRTEVAGSRQSVTPILGRPLVLGIIKLLLGVGLLFGARGLAGFLRTLRTAGTPKE
jgi:hypothetical protein